jgi:uracil-DNA glycosylase
MPRIELTLVIGQYAQKHYLPREQKTNLTDRVKRWEEFLPEHFLLPHPSPRNNIWLRKNPWFDEETIPALQQRVGQLIQPSEKGV